MVCHVQGRWPNIRCIDANAFSPPAQHKHIKVSRFSLKAFALYNSAFDEILMLDSDNLALFDPTPLFDSIEFKTYGNMFWPDYWTDFSRNRQVSLP